MLANLPREVIRTIALNIYDPLVLTQQDRLTWGIFSTVDMHQERQDALLTLVSLGSTCRRIRREVRVVLFRCIRIPSIEHAEEVIAHRDDWARFVKSIIIDLTMFDDNSMPGLSSRSCWSESSLLTTLLSSLPGLHHLSFFADASDDSTLALLFSSLISHPSQHITPPPTSPPSPTPTSILSGPSHITPSSIVPFAARLKSFGWRQRAPPPEGFRAFSQASTFVSILHVLRHAYDLSFLVLDADMDVIEDADVLAALRELNLRTAPLGQEPALVSLMLCGEIAGWQHRFLKQLVDTFSGIKELFIDRPLGKNPQSSTTVDELLAIIDPLKQLTYLRLLQLGSYTFSPIDQQTLVAHLASILPQLIIVGLLGPEGDTNWWGVWRRPSVSDNPMIATAMSVQPLGDGHLRVLEARLDAEGQRRPVSSGLSTPRVMEQQQPVDGELEVVEVADEQQSPQSLKMSLDHLVA